MLLFCFNANLITSKILPFLLALMTVPTSRWRLSSPDQFGVTLTRDQVDFRVKHNFCAPETSTVLEDMPFGPSVSKSSASSLIMLVSFLIILIISF